MKSSILLVPCAGGLTAVIVTLLLAAPAVAQQAPAADPAQPAQPGTAPAQPSEPAAPGGQPAQPTQPAAQPPAAAQPGVDAAPQEPPQPPPQPTAPQPAPASAPPIQPTSEPTSMSEAAPEPRSQVGYNKGFFIESGDGLNQLVLQGRVQPRFTYEALEGADDEANFAIQRARVTLKGHVFSKDIKYKFQTDFGKGFVTLKDFYVDYLAAPALIIRVGQYKKPFSRQQITSSGKQELVDRSITDKAFGAGRDIGLMIHNNYEKSPDFEYALGIFNGTGDSPSLSGDVEVDPATGEGEISSGKFSNVPGMFNPALALRLGYNHGGVSGYSEADLEGGPLRLGVAGGTIVDLDGDNEGNDSRLRGEVDYVLKVDGFSTTGGLYLDSIQNGSTFGDRRHQATGFHIQAGYVFAKMYQPVLRFAAVNPRGDENNEQELAFGFAVYPHKHGFKWQTDVAALTHTSSDTTDAVVRSQLQLSF